MVSLSACVVFFSVLLSPLRDLPAPLLGLVELFSLVPRLTADRAGFVTAALCSGWGGLSVLCQSAAAAQGLSLRPLVLGKALQGLLSGLLAALLAPLVL